ncbi:serine hydrolase [Qipengyuania sp. JC766]|uniref:serine hydrolase domain-containing protein n=1 Tax=Qipengyuania sp. JC766 TaxID=3232139 RepID=UPI00345AE0DD
MRTPLLAALASVLLASCATVPSGQNVAATYASTPETPLSFEEQQSVLFWDDATRSDRFREMERYFAGTEVAPPARTRSLPEGRPLPEAVTTVLDAYLTSQNAAGIMVLHDGRVRYEKYGLGFGPEQRWTSFSVAKSFTSTLLGAALKDGAIQSLSDPVSKYVPGLKGSAYDDVSVEQLATMTSGVRWNEDYTDANSDVAKMLTVEPVAGESQVVTYMKTLPREAPAGEKWVYKTGETNLLGVLVENATGMTLAEYAKGKIVDPAGFEDRMFWMSDLTGGSIGGCCLSLRLADYARFGQFALEGGKGVVPDRWFIEAGSPQVEFGNGYGYGYQWWTYPNTGPTAFDGPYGAQGIFGQSIAILPAHNVVVAVVGNWPTATSPEGRAQMRQVLAAIENAVGSDDQAR